jgi:hypothetical protein
MYSVWSEWDLGIGRQLFKTEDAAWEYAATIWMDHELDQQLGMTFKEAKQDNLIIQVDYEEVNE